MLERQCYHCKERIEEGQPHGCSMTTEAALTAELSEDLREAWERLRETATEFGEQRIYASHNSIMFSRKACYFFVRPKRSHLEVCLFLGRALKAPQVRRAVAASTTKTGHLIQIRHRDEVEPPITDWLEEAYEFSEIDSRRFAGIVARKQAAAAKAAVKKPAARKRTRPAAAKKKSAPKAVKKR